MALVYNLINNGTEYEIGVGSCSLGSIVIPDTYLGKPVTSIAPFAFQYCNLTSITMSNNITNIGNFAFSYTANLSNVKLSENLTTIRNGCFYSSVALENIVIPNNVSTIGSSAFFGSILKNITLPDNLTQLGANSFGNCTFRSITMPKKLTFIDNNCFSDCLYLIRVNFLGNFPRFGTNCFTNTNINLKLYRKKNFVTGWPDSVQGVPVVLWSDNVVKSGGTGKLTTWNRSMDRDALKYIQLIESLTSPNNPITPDSKDKINSFIKQIKQIVPWNNFTAWTFIRGQNAFPPFLDSTDNRYNGIVKTFGGLGGGEVISTNTSTSNGDEGLSFSSPAGVLSISPSSFFTSVKSIFGVFKPKGNYYYIGTIDQNIFSVRGGDSGPISSTYSNLYYRLDAVYSRITRNSILNIQTNNTSVFNLNFYKSLGTIFDANSTSNYSNGIKQFTASPLSVPNASLFSGVSIGGGIVDYATIPFVFVSDLVLTDAQMLAIHNIYKSTLGASLTNSQL
jgi:hypothetical protein